MKIRSFSFVMLYLRLLVSVVCLGSAWTLAEVPDTARRLVEGWNRHIKNNERDQLLIEREVSWFQPLFQFGFKFLLSDFSTLQLRGNQQVIDKTQNEHETIYRFDLAVGYDKLEIFNKFHMNALFLLTQGMADVKLKGDVARINGTVTLQEDGRCSPVLDSLRIEKLGYLDVTVRFGNNADIAPVSIGNTLEYILNRILPKYKEDIQGFFQDYLRRGFEEENFASNLCQIISK